tara:strand:- start:317 stop:628 length:312 start_codon:yes stop_codon:yes gene_type:complete
MRLLVIAMVLSLGVSGGAFAGNDYKLLDEVQWSYQKTKTFPTDCKQALSKGKIIFSETKKEKHSGGYFVVTRVMDIYFNDRIYRFRGLTHGMKCQSFTLIEDK